MLAHLMLIFSCAGWKSSRGRSIDCRYGKTPELRTMEIANVT